MSDFRTTLQLPTYPFRITHQDLILSMGSCFAEHIGRRLAEFKFRSVLNPFGILYNPVSIGRGLKILHSGRHFTEEDLFQYQELWHSFDHHGAYSHPDKKTALENINNSLEQGRHLLSRANRLLLTLGTAFVFEYKATGSVVANCHKLPGQQFQRRRLEVPEVVNHLEKAIDATRSQANHPEVIITISPVRHIRDGLAENQRSKATLLLAVDQLCRRFDYVHYFPSYELLLDDLRDYRFFEADMVHPNRQAIDYIWNYFQQAFFPKPTQKLIQRIAKINAAVNHRPFHPDSKQHRQFLKKQLEKMEALEREFPHLDFREEKEKFAIQLSG